MNKLEKEELGTLLFLYAICRGSNYFALPVNSGILHNHNEVSLFSLFYVFFISRDIKWDIVFYAIYQAASHLFQCPD